jgi:DNA polymerase-1
VRAIADTLGSDPKEVLHCLTYGSKFRRDLHPEYKAHRGLKPPGYLKLRQEILAEDARSTVFDEIEADDIISITADRLAKDGIDYTVVSGDKDMKQVPGKHYWPFAKEVERTFNKVSPRQAMGMLWMQTLTGDMTDGIPGLKGVGPKTAERILGDIDPLDIATSWAAVVEAYESKGETEADALLTLHLVRLLKDGEYNERTKQVTLWQPLPMATPPTTPPAKPTPMVWHTAPSPKPSRTMFSPL